MGQLIKYINLRFVFLWLKYSFSKFSRYRYLFKILIEEKPKSILEIGVYQGKRSSEMISLAESIAGNIKFFGFDLFEKITKEKIRSEFSKNPLSEKKIFEKLNFLYPETNIQLIKGDTTVTLKKFKIDQKIDFIFIDGGHSIETIRNDWQNVKKLINRKSVVIFDDYYHDDLISKKFGSKKIIENLEKKYISKILPSKDIVVMENRKILNSLVLVKIK